LKEQTQKQPANKHDLLHSNHPLHPPALTMSLILDPSTSLRSSALFPGDDDGLFPRDDDGLFPRDDDGLFPRDDDGLFPRDDDGLFPRDDDGLLPEDDDGLLPVKPSLCFWEVVDMADIGRARRSAAAAAPKASAAAETWAFDNKIDRDKNDGTSHIKRLRRKQKVWVGACVLRLVVYE